MKLHEFDQWEAGYRERITELYDHFFKDVGAAKARMSHVELITPILAHFDKAPSHTLMELVWPMIKYAMTIGFFELQREHVARMADGRFPK